MERETERVIRCAEKVKELDYLLQEVSVLESAFTFHEENILALRAVMGESYQKILACKRDLGIV